MNRNARLIWIALFVLYIACIAYLCFSEGREGLDLPKDIWNIPFDKCVHFLMFIPFPVLGTVAFHYKSWWRTLCLMTLVANIFAFTFELLQSRITETRTTDPADLNANILGITVGLLVMLIAGLIAKKR